MSPVSRPAHAAAARWGLLATCLALAGTLVALAFASYREIERSSTALARGQGEILLHSIRQSLSNRPEHGPPTAALLGRIVAAGAESGLRYVALFHPDGRGMIAAGKPSFPIPDPLPPPHESLTVFEARGAVYRAIVRLPPPHRPDRDDDSGRPGRPLLVLEFEASAIRGLTVGSARTLAAASAAAAMLALAGVVFFRLAREREHAERQVDQQKRLSSLGEMSAVLAHEIRNPLASLKGHAQLLAEQLPGADPAGRKARRIAREAARLEVLLNNLLDFARGGPLERQDAAPAALLADCAREAATGSSELSSAPLHRGGDATDPIVLDTAGAPAVWSLDPARFSQAVTNVLRNALEVSPVGSPVRLRAALADGALVVSVLDRGPGLPGGREQEIFEPFVTTRSKGTGLGLTVARRILEMHGGTLTAARRPGGGAEFHLRIPKA